MKQVEGPQATVKLTVRTENFDVLAISWLHMTADEWHQLLHATGNSYLGQGIKPGTRFSSGGRGTLQCDVEWIAHAPEQEPTL